MRYYYRDSGQVLGPVSSDDLAELTKAGRLAKDAWVLPEGTTRWLRANKIGSRDLKTSTTGNLMTSVFAALKWMFRTLPLPVSLFVVFGLVLAALTPVAFGVNAYQGWRIRSVYGISNAEYQKLETDHDLSWGDIKLLAQASKAGGATVQAAAAEWSRLGLDREELAELSSAAAAEKVGLLELTSSFDMLMEFPRFAAARNEGVTLQEFKACRTDWRSCRSDYAVVEIYLGAANVTVADTCKQAASEAASYADPRIPFTAFFFPTPASSSKSLLDEGVIRLADTVGYQNGFGAYQDVRVICVFDIASRTAFVESL